MVHTSIISAKNKSKTPENKITVDTFRRSLEKEKARENSMKNVLRNAARSYGNAAKEESQGIDELEATSEKACTEAEGSENSSHEASAVNTTNVYPDSTKGTLPELPNLFNGGLPLESREPSIFFCDMNFHQREYVLKKLKFLWIDSNPESSIQSLINELNMTQGLDWCLEEIDNPCDVTGSHAYRGSVLSFSFDQGKKKYVLWRKCFQITNPEQKNWIW